MSTIASTLLEFILDLFRDADKAAAYKEDPEGALKAAGLPDTTPEEVADLIPMVADYGTVGGWGGHGKSWDDCDHDGKPSAAKPVADEDEDKCEDWVAPVERDECDEKEEAGNSSGGGQHQAPAPAGGTETVVITHIEKTHITNNETNIEIDASHSIWVSGDAQAIFGDVKGDVSQIDNEGGIVAGDDVKGSTVDNSDHSVNDSYNKDSYNKESYNKEVEIEDSPINVGGNQAVDSFNQDNDGVDVDHAEKSFNGNGSNNEDNDVVADRGGQVGDNTTVDDVTVVKDSENVGNTTTVTDSNNNNDLSKENVGNDHSKTDNSKTDNSTNGSYNGNDFSQDNDGVDDSLNNNDLSQDNDGVDDSFNNNGLSQDNDTKVLFEESFNVDNDGVDDSLNGNASATGHEADAEGDAVVVG